MRAQPLLVEISEPGDQPSLAQAAAQRETGLRDVGAARDAEAVDLVRRAERLAGRDRLSGAIPEPAIARPVERLLDPVDAEALDHPDRETRLVGGAAAADVDHRQNRVAEDLARPSNAGRIHGDR